MNTLIFDKSDPAIAAALKGCRVGEEKEITIKIMPTVDDETKLVADITEIVSGYAEEDPVIDVGEEEEDEDSGMVQNPIKKNYK